MKWVGLTGGIATGKSTVAKMLRDFGLPVVDADELARQTTAPGTEGHKAVVREFGEGILAGDGSIDREKLGGIVFSDESRRAVLEKILHPMIQDLRAKDKLRLENSGAEIAFYDVPLLFEKNLAGEFDATVLVYAPQDLQRRRLRERNGLSDEEIERRLNAQMPIDEKMKLADYVVFNKGSLAELKMNVMSVLRELGVNIA